MNLRVCRVNLREQACDDIVNNLHYTPTGINSFYKVVCSRYIGIPKLFVADYLKKQVDYQVGRSYHKAQNTHIIAQTQNERWKMDLIDMTRYPNINNMRYIVNVVDYFSKYIMV